MRSLHLGKYFPPYRGGMETYLRDLTTALSRVGHHCSVLVHQSQPGWRSSEENYTAGGVTLSVSRVAVWLRLFFTPISPGFPFRLHQLIKRERPEILHLHMPNASVFWCLFVPSARRLPWIVQWQSDVVASEHSLGLRLFLRFYQIFETAVLRRSKLILVSSPPYLESSAALQPYREKCHVVPLGLDPANLSSAPANPGVEVSRGGRLQVLAIGRLTYYKGFDHLIRAARSYDNIEIHLVGSGDQERELKSLAIDLGVSDRVIFHGAVEDDLLAELIAACDCLCLPSIERTEAFGLVLLEAMYWRKATVASDVMGSGMGWIVQDGVTGLKVIPGDSTALAEAFARLDNHRDEAQSFGVAGRERFDTHFHIDRCAAGVIESYREVLLPRDWNLKDG